MCPMMMRRDSDQHQFTTLPILTLLVVHTIQNRHYEHNVDSQSKVICGTGRKQSKPTDQVDEVDLTV